MIYTFNRTVHFVLAFALVLESGSSAAADESPRRIDQMLRDFSVGRIGYQKEEFTQTIDLRTFIDLDLQKVIKKLIEDAPSRMAKDRIAWLLTHPYLDAKVIRARQEAVREIAESDELFEQLANALEPARRTALVRKFNAIFKDSTRLSRQSLARAMPRERLLHWKTFGSLFLIGLGAFLQYDLVQRGMRMTTDPSWSLGTQTLITLGILAGSSYGYRAHLPAVEMKRRARQLERILRTVDFDQTTSALLVQIGAQCQSNAGCARGLLRAGSALPVDNAVAMVVRLLGLAPWVAFPVSAYARSDKDPAISIVAVMTELETLYTIAKRYRAHRDEVVWPTIEAEGPARVEIDRGKHPRMWLEGKDVSPYTIELNEDGAKSMILTGPNTGGKTTAQQTYLVSSLMAMAGWFVPARAMTIKPGYVLSNFRVRGSITAETSSFQAQAQRVSDLTTFAADPQRAYPVYFGMDEILRGTSGQERRGWERASLHFIHETPNALLMLASHNRAIADMSTRLNRDGEPPVFNMKVSLTGHLMLPGVSTDHNAIEVMRESGAPDVLIENSRDYLNRRPECATPLEATP